MVNATGVKSIKPELFASLAIAGLTFGMPSIKEYFMVMVTPWLALLWSAIVIVGFIRHKRHGLWLLLGAPLALWWPCLMIMILASCAHNVRACP